MAVTIFLTLLGICRIFIQEEDLGTVIVIRVESMSHLEGWKVTKMTKMEVEIIK